MRFIDSEDQEEVELMTAIAQEYVYLREEAHKDLASRIANAVWGALKK